MRRLIGPLLIGIAGAAVLIALGVWQVQRLAWKEALLADIEARIAAAPVALPADPDPEADRYLPVRAEGTIGDEELHVLVSTKAQGAGFRIVAPFETGGGRRLLLDRGFVPDEAKEDARRTGPAAVVGNLHWPDDRNPSTPENDPAENYWFARDLDQMAEALETEPLLLVVRAEEPPAPGIAPLPVDTSGIPNDHLEYAVTWFGLAAVWVAMSGYFLWRTARRTA
ncbi:SURF1 family protein [Rhodosalinus halophilus]|uniref:SURF1-like protein n=1 Tax=Rhodosalinus halophilus TaxID=2259333 RepID=A0A365UBQ0_9RHOB|nr:SURF1 family protein [Rhodosalinus halophilus]RBI86573.1 SURF1 family protein [Rhodosalinus halophilus]